MNVEEFKKAASEIYSEIYNKCNMTYLKVGYAADVFYYLAYDSYAKYCGVGMNEKERERS